MTLLSLLPAILLTCTSFTKILVVLGLTRNALGLQQTPPNQVLAGLALFLSLFIMAPVLGEMNDDRRPALPRRRQDLVAGVPRRRRSRCKTFMLDHTDDDELQLLTNVAKRDLPKDRDDVSMATLVPAFVLSELKQAFIIGFIIFIPFLVIDIVVSGALMALGMMMMPPVMVSLPFKLLLFVLVDGWGLVIKSLVASYQTRRAMTDTTDHPDRAPDHAGRAEAVRADPGDLAGHRLHDLAVPVDDPDPGVHALVRARSWSASASRCWSAATGCCTR